VMLRQTFGAPLTPVILDDGRVPLRLVTHDAHRRWRFSFLSRLPISYSPRPVFGMEIT
jgi:hypothetical protein